MTHICQHAFDSCHKIHWNNSTIVAKKSSTKNIKLKKAVKSKSSKKLKK